MLYWEQYSGKSHQQSLEDGKKGVCERLIFMMCLEDPQMAKVQNLDFSKFFMKRGLDQIKYLLVPIRDTHNHGWLKTSQ